MKRSEEHSDKLMSSNKPGVKKYLDYKGIKISYSIQGEGEALVFLHGYLEAKEIWMDFSKRFTSHFKVICIDLPGHGESGLLGSIHEMDEMASVVAAVLLYERIEKSVLIGHSLGGYVVMSFVKDFSDKLKGYCLFHSTCFADSEEKKNNREREITLVKCGKKNQIIYTNIPKGFADSNLESMKEEINRVKEIALRSPDDGIIALLRGMKNREDHTKILSHSATPSLLIWGKEDNYISEEVFNSLLKIAPHSSTIILKNSGHMGFLEEPDLVYAGLSSFLHSIK